MPRLQTQPALVLTTAAAAATAAACAPVRRPAAPTFPFGAAGRVDAVAPGVRHEQFVVSARGERGPLAVHVLRVEPGRRGCARVSALKPAAAAEGRATTSTLVRALAGTDPAVAGGVNADFFSFTPPGVPAAAHVHGGRVIAGPTARPVFAVDSAGRPWIGELRAGGSVAAGSAVLPVHGWNRPRRDDVVVFDGAWGLRTDSVPGRVFVTLAPSDRPGAAPGPLVIPAGRGYRVLRVDTGAVVPIAPATLVAVVGPEVAGDVRARWLRLQAGAEVTGAVAVLPFHPAEAVGGRPVLVRDGRVADEVDTTGDAGFRGPNPRTAIGITRRGALLVATLDGRQPGYSTGAALRETAELMRALGAEEALNLDGGGSTTMVVRGAPGDTLAVVNRPSDAAGERPVGNALAVRACPRR